MSHLALRMKRPTEPEDLRYVEVLPDITDQKVREAVRDAVRGELLRMEGKLTCVALATLAMTAAILLMVLP